jgi:hypothetical protein
MRLKTQYATVLPILTFGKYTVGNTLVGRTVLKLNSGRLGGWLEGEARRSILRKVRAEARGPATRCENRLLQDSNMVHY